VPNDATTPVEVSSPAAGKLRQQRSARWSSITHTAAGLYVI